MKRIFFIFSAMLLFATPLLAGGAISWIDGTLTVQITNTSEVFTVTDSDGTKTFHNFPDEAEKSGKNSRDVLEGLLKQRDQQGQPVDQMEDHLAEFLKTWAGRIVGIRYVTRNDNVTAVRAPGSVEAHNKPTMEKGEANAGQDND